MSLSRRQVCRGLGALGLVRGVSARRAQAQPTGEAVWAWHVSLAPAWFDPVDTPAQSTPFGLLYALHDALIRPLPGGGLGPSLAESWSESPDGLAYTFTLRPGLRFHNGDPCTAEDVQFSFARYRGTGAQALHAAVAAVEVLDARTVRFQLHTPWPDFLTFYGTTAAGLVVPKRDLEQVGEAGFQQHPIGLGPYQFVRHTPGVDVVLEAYDGYWRTVPPIKRLRMQGVPEGTTRLAMLKQGEADIAMALEGPLAEAVQRDPRLTLVATQVPGIQWLEFTEQWNPTSVWADPRVRLAVNYALDRQAMNEAACLGYCPPSGVIIPRVLEYALQTEPVPYDPPKAKQLLTDAGYPHGFDAGDLIPIPPFFLVAEAVVNALHAVGIRVQMRLMERAAFYAAWREKKLRGLVQVASGAAGNAATRIETFIASTGAYAYGGYPDLDALYQQQARERDRATRAALLARIQQLTVERVMFAPLIDLRLLVGVGFRVAAHGLNVLSLSPFPAPEVMRLKAP
jgi:peptide/nickel transport system substrate-binding protein